MEFGLEFVDQFIDNLITPTGSVVVLLGGAVWSCCNDDAI